MSQERRQFLLGLVADLRTEIKMLEHHRTNFRFDDVEFSKKRIQNIEFQIYARLGNRFLKLDDGKIVIVQAKSNHDYFVRFVEEVL